MIVLYLSCRIRKTPKEHNEETYRKLPPENPHKPKEFLEDITDIPKYEDPIRIANMKVKAGKAGELNSHMDICSSTSSI